MSKEVNNFGLPPKPLIWKTNFNNKLSCERFVHVDTAPRSTVPFASLVGLFEITTEDASHPPVTCSLFNFKRFRLGEIIDFNGYTSASHGMDAYDFHKYYLTKNPNANADTELAVYLYVKH